MNKFTKLALATTMALASTAALANGEGGFDFTDLNPVDLKDGWSAKVGITSDAVWRGISVNDENPALGANLNYQNHRGWYVGTSIFQSDSAFVPGSDYINTIYGGLTFDFLSQAELPAYFQVKHYNIDAGYGLNVDFEEFEFGIAEQFSDAEIGISVAYAPDYFDILDDATYVSGYAEYSDVDISTWTYTQDWTIGVQVGHTENDLEDYVDFKVYFGKQYEGGVLDGLGVELAYHDTSSIGVLQSDITDDRVAGTLSYTF